MYAGVTMSRERVGIGKYQLPALSKIRDSRTWLRYDADDPPTGRSYTLDSCPSHSPNLLMAANPPARKPMAMRSRGLVKRA